MTFQRMLVLIIVTASCAFGQTTALDRFQQADKNGDGKLSRDELPPAVFDRLDADKDGFVTPEELRQIRNRRN